MRSALRATWITEWYAYDRGVLDALGLAPHEKIAGFVHIGRPMLAPDDRAAALADIVTRFGYRHRLTGRSSNPRTIGGRMRCPTDKLVVTGSPGQAGR